MEPIIKQITKALSKFDKSIPGLQSELYKLMLQEVKRLDIKGDKIAVTVKNLSILSSIKNKLNRLILNPEYKAEIKEFAKAFNTVYNLQFEYWKSIESTFKPRPLLKAIRNQAINDTVKSLTTQGISANVSDNIINILRTNITAGGSYKDLTEQLRQSLINTPESKGILDRYVKTIASDSINQFNRQYTQIVSSDLGYTWFLYANTEIDTSRPFCQSMVERHKYFHISQVPEMLEGRYLGEKMRYSDNKDGKEKTVDIYSKTGLPYGFIAGTNTDNFFIRCAGYQCGHSINPVNVKQVPADIVAAVYATAEYKAWAEAHGKDRAIVETKEIELFGTNKKDNLAKAVELGNKSGYDTEIFAMKNNNIAMASPSNKKIYINSNSDFWKNPVARQQEAYNKGILSSPNPMHTIYHEVSHIRHKVSLNWNSKEYQRGIAAQVSNYAKTNPSEFVAEAYAGIKSGIKYSKEVMQLYHLFGGK